MFLIALAAVATLFFSVLWMGITGEESAVTVIIDVFMVLATGSPERTMTHGTKSGQHTPAENTAAVLPRVAVSAVMVI